MNLALHGLNERLLRIDGEDSANEALCGAYGGVAVLTKHLAGVSALKRWREAVAAQQKEAVKRCADGGLRRNGRAVQIVLRQQQQEVQCVLGEASVWTVRDI